MISRTMASPSPAPPRAGLIGQPRKFFKDNALRLFRNAFAIVDEIHIDPPRLLAHLDPQDPRIGIAVFPGV